MKEKITAAKRAGIETIVLPAENRPDMADIPKHVLRGLRILFVREFDDVLPFALFPGGHV